MKWTHPENLRKGYKYKFSWKTYSGVVLEKEGEFLRIGMSDVKPKNLMLFFRTEKGVVPFDYQPDMKFLMIGEEYEK
jgi:hypothetical protein